MRRMKRIQKERNDNALLWFLIGGVGLALNAFFLSLLTQDSTLYYLGAATAATMLLLCAVVYYSITKQVWKLKAALMNTVLVGGLSTWLLEGLVSMNCNGTITNPTTDSGFYPYTIGVTVMIFFAFLAAIAIRSSTHQRWLRQNQRRRKLQIAESWNSGQEHR